MSRLNCIGLVQILRGRSEGSIPRGKKNHQRDSQGEAARSAGEHHIRRLPAADQRGQTRFLARPEQHSPRF